MMPIAQSTRFFLLLCVAWIGHGCGRRQVVAPRVAKSPTIASTVPAATDLLVGMGCADHLVGICNYDLPRPEIAADVPKVGDLLTIDWEQIAATHPTVLVSGLPAERRPAGFADRAARNHVHAEYLQVDRLTDIDPAITKLGSWVDESDKAAAAVKLLDARLLAVRQKAAGRPALPALLVNGTDPTRVIGPNSYIDDLLQTAGGTNVVTETKNAYPTLDRETLIGLHPKVVFQLIPNATPAELVQAAAAWKKFPTITAPVVVVTDPYALQPGWHVADLAEKIAKALAAL